MKPMFGTPKNQAPKTAPVKPMAPPQPKHPKFKENSSASKLAGGKFNMNY